MIVSDKTTERGLCELYQNDPERADYVVFGRIANPNRRGFLKGAGLGAMAAVTGGFIPFHREMPAGLIPAALAESLENFQLQGKDGLTVLNDRPINAETPAHLLDDDVTPNARHFVRNNGVVPTLAEAMQLGDWKLTVDGLVDSPLSLSLEDLKNDFEVIKLKLQVECGGNGRAGFNPPAKGNQWTVGAIGNAEWTGVRMRDVLNAAGVKDSVIYTAHYGLDQHLSGDPKKSPISRGVPIAKALEKNTLIAFEMNGEPIPTLHGFPVRIVAGGWPGSCSQKWLRRIELRDVVHDGAKMTGTSYRVPRYPVAPGTKVPDEDFVIIESMPVKSLITFPENGVSMNDNTLQVRGHAWAGERNVKAMQVSIDFGATWIEAELDPPPNKYAWQRWRATVSFPIHGYYEIWARATDDQDIMQPFAINWNPKGYLNNSLHRIAVNVG
jgi:DMSO/TMAO reductase YedYZ molybdopterin-dependent catalytic subunit